MAKGVLTPKERQALGKHSTSVDCRVQWLAVIEGYKARSVRDFLVPFRRSPNISLYLIQQLFGELGRRLRRS